MSAGSNGRLLIRRLLMTSALLARQRKAGQALLRSGSWS